MALTSVDKYIEGRRSLISIRKNSITSTANNYFSSHYTTGETPIGSYTYSNALTDGTYVTYQEPGFPPYKEMVYQYYITGASVYQRYKQPIIVTSMIFRLGPVNFNSDLTVTQPQSYVGRMPDSNYIGTEVWMECTTASSGTVPSCYLYYKNEDNTSRTGQQFIFPAHMTVGQMIRIPLQGKDRGIRQVVRVIMTDATAGAYQLYVTRPLFQIEADQDYGTKKVDFLGTGAIKIMGYTAIFFMQQCTTTSSGEVKLQLELTDV